MKYVLNRKASTAVGQSPLRYQKGMTTHYGDFSSSGDSYIITRPDLPERWFNFITNGRYVATFDQAGNGQANADGWSLLNPNSQVGRAIYLYDHDTNEYWNVGWLPSRQELGTYQARHGLGTTTIDSTKSGISVTASFWVPEDSICEIWSVSIRNISAKKRRLGVFLVAEWDLGDPNQFQRAILHDDKLYAAQMDPVNSRGRLLFFGLDQKIDSFDLNATTFIGPYGNMSEPEAVRAGKCSRSQANFQPSLAALQKNITLSSKSHSQFLAFLGASEPFSQKQSFNQAFTTALRQTKKVIHQYSQSGAIEAIEAKVQAAWQKRLGTLFVRTPVTSVNHAVNLWQKYQAVSLALASPNNSTLTLTERADYLIGAITAEPLFVARQLEELFSFQYKDGSLVDSLLLGRATTDVDPQISLLTTLVSYLKETGQTDWLKTVVPFYDGGEGRLVLHLIRATEWSCQKLSRRHLVTDGDGTESVISSAKLVGILRELLPIFETIGEHELVKKYTGLIEKISQAIATTGWDDQWFIAGISEARRKIGSQRSESQKIILAAQTWPTIAHIEPAHKTTAAIDAVWKKLSSRFGPVTNLPSQPQVTQLLENIPSQVPGTGDNGGIVLAEVARLFLAELIRGRADKAFQLWEQMAPWQETETYRAEPYVYADRRFGPDHPLFGQADQSWQTPAAALFWQYFTEDLLGIRPVLNGLKIDPCLPRDWRHVEISRHFRSAEYIIRITNPFRINRGVDRIVVDGLRLTGTVIPAFARGSHFVEVTLG